MMRRVVALALALTCAGCLLPAWASQLGRAAAWVGDAIALADSGSRVFFDRHPNLDGPPKVARAVRRAQAGLAALSGAVARNDEAGALQARPEALAAYASLLAELAELGILSGLAVGGVETAAPLPGPLALPSSSEVAAALR